mmetsp:Transcript_1493/g.3119  ORF Transcript_1493/g.3119 Transcript_1493/m.3119 type:complete len:285 (+) Transcript_1493:801-1655(+)
MHLVLSHKVHRKVLDGHGKIKKSAIRSVGGVDDGIGLALGQSLVEFQSEGSFVFPFRRQMTLHGANKGPGADRKSLQISFAFIGRNQGAVVEGISHSHKITGVIDIHTPVLSGFVPSLVGLVSSENEEQTQETRRESERVHRKGQNRSVLSTKHSGVNFTHKIRVLASKHVPEHGEGSNQRDNQNLTTDVLVNSRLCGAHNVLEKSIGGSVFDPILVGVDSSAVLSGFLSVRNFAIIETRREGTVRSRGRSLDNIVAVGDKGNSVANGASCQQEWESNFHHRVE